MDEWIAHAYAVRDMILTRNDAVLAENRDRRPMAAAFGGVDRAMLTRAVDAFARAPESERDRLAAALTTIHTQFGSVMRAGSFVGFVCPSYPKASPIFQAKIALGIARPIDLVPGLTAHEAHEALTAGFADASQFLMGAKAGVAVRVASIAVARWVLACMHDERNRALRTHHADRRPDGTVVEGTYLDRLDEVQEGDLVRGTATGVHAVFERANARTHERIRADLVRHVNEGDFSFVQPFPVWWVPVRCATLLRTEYALREEGKAMRHCVGDYDEDVAAEEAFIVRIRVPRVMGGTGVARMFWQSTAELNAFFTLAQHKGYANAEPHPMCVAALSHCLRTWKAKWESLEWDVKNAWIKTHADPVITAARAL